MDMFERILAEIKNGNSVLVLKFFTEEPINISVDMLTGKGLKFILNIDQNCSKHTYVKTFDWIHLSTFIILLQNKTCGFYFS